MQMAEKEGSFLEFIHIFAIANVLQRPIVIHASDADRETFGDGEGGVTACFLPTRLSSGAWHAAGLAPSTAGPVCQVDRC